MKKIFLAAGAALLYLNCSFKSNDGGMISPIEKFADSLFQASVEENFIAGASVIVMKGEEMLVDKSYGYASLELNVAVPPHASFEIGSVTKQFTAAAILKLDEMGKLSLDEDFTKYVDFDTKGRKISVRRLLDHTSGIASYTEMPVFWPLSLHQYERDTLVKLVQEEDFLFEPGEALIYNNSAYFLLGLIIEKVSGKSYEEFLQEAIFGPLKMENSYYCSTSRVVRNKVYGYGFSEEGLQQKNYLDHTWPYAAGSLCSTTADLLKWLKAIHRDQFLGKELYHSLITPETLSDGTRVRYAKGLVNQELYGHRIIRHGGGINGFLSETAYFPDEDLIIICLVNTTGPHGAGYFADHLAWRILEKKAAPLKALDLDLKSLVGKFSGQVRGRKLSVEVGTSKDGPVIVQEGQPTPDTLTNYIGRNTWMDEEQLIVITKDELRIDMGYGYYILKRQ